MRNKTIESNKIQAKDLINVGIFTAIYFILFFGIGMLGFIPVFMVIFPALIPIVTGIPFMLFLTRVKKFGMISIMGVILGLLMFATGHTWVPIVTGIVFSFLADLIVKAGQYKSFKHDMFGFATFSLWYLGAMLPLWVMRDSYFQYIRESMGDVYAEKLLGLTPLWVFFVIIICVFIGGLIGAKLGRSVLKKHFERAGIA